MNEKIGKSIHKVDIRNGLKNLSLDGEWLTRYLLPDGSYTRTQKGYPISKKDWEKTKTINSFEVSGLNVLDIGCSEGIYSFYLAEKGAKVLGIDIDKMRITKANFIKKALGYNNVRFECGSILDKKYRTNLPQVDLVIAWGFLHRVADPFNALIIMGSLCNSISLEWRAPAMLFPPGLSGAVHNPKGKFEWKNIDADFATRLRNQDLAEFWRMNTGAVFAILKRYGFNVYDLNTIKKEANILGVTFNWIKFLLNICVKRKKIIGWKPSRRIHMLAEKQKKMSPLKICNDREFKPALWDGRFGNYLNG